MFKTSRKVSEFNTDIFNGGDYHWVDRQDNIESILKDCGLTRQIIGENSPNWEVDALIVKDYEGERLEVWGVNAHGGMIPNNAYAYILWRENRTFMLSLEIDHQEECKILNWWDLNEEEQKEYGEDQSGSQFFRYRDTTYNLASFPKFGSAWLQKCEVPHPFAEWHAICEICSGCGIVIKLSECGEGLTAGYYTC